MLFNMEREIKIINRRSGVSRPDFTEIHQAILREKDSLLPTSIESLQKSFEDNLATVLMDSDRAVGFIRFSPLLTGKVKNFLGLESDFPEITEIGSAVILKNENYRGKGYYPKLRNHLLESVVEEVKQKRLLVLGTTKNIIVYKVLPKAKELGIEFYPSVHTEFSMIAPFTCVCKPDFGCGFQLSTNCSKRVTKDQVEKLEHLARSSSDGIKVSCIMYVSDKQLASEIDIKLKDVFTTIDPLDPQKALVDRLKTGGYYE